VKACTQLVVEWTVPVSHRRPGRTLCRQIPSGGCWPTGCSMPCQVDEGSW